MDDLSLTLKSMSAIGDLLKKVTNAADAIKNADLIDLIAGLKLESAKLKATLAVAEEKILEIENENKKLKEKLKCQNTPIEKNGLFYTQDNSEEPCCPNCWHGKEKLIKLLKAASTAEFFGYSLQCPVCNQQYR